jgi:hypothetical protein
MPHPLFSQRNNLFIWPVAGANLFGEKILLSGRWRLVCSERQILLAGGR